MNESARDAQWIYRDALGSGDNVPTAIFLASDYSEVIFRATCDRGSGELVLRYRLPELLRSAPVEAMEITSAAGTAALATIREGDDLVGRATVSEEAAAILAAEGELAIYAPNEMGESWYVGGAEPLRRLALGCR